MGKEERHPRRQGFKATVWEEQECLAMGSISCYSHRSNNSRVPIYQTVKR